jgi:CubicO group peptidase (beta-lactamase class C family)
LNAMLLGWIVERVSGQSLDRFATRSIFTPIGMTQTMFAPPRPLRRRIAPSNLWHGTPIAGVVNDQNAARLGDVAGHAGLFATGHDLARYAQIYLNGGAPKDGPRIFQASTIAQFTSRAAKDRALGWELRDTTTADNAGTRMGAAAFGHTGFTGTSIWIDPDRGVFVIVLTNRVYAPRNGRSIRSLKAIRGAIADAAVAFVDQTCGPRLTESPTPSRC